MTDENPSCMNHVSIGTNDFEKAVTFYSKVLETIGCKKIMNFPNAVAFGKKFPEFWVQNPINGEKASVGNGTHFGFFASTKEEVDAFYKAALEAGAKDEGPAGHREEYGAAYYGCFVRDLDGHKIEATYWDESKAPS